MTPAAITPARVNGFQELFEWIELAEAKGADRFELWSKVRGTEQQRAHVAAESEPFDIADEVLAVVERDGRAEAGHVAYAIFAYRGGEKAPSHRAFVSSVSSRAMIAVTPHGAPPATFAGGAAESAASPSLVLTTVLTTVHQMVQDLFATFQKENAHQRNLNESMMRATTGHFDALARSYERAFGDLTGRHDAALREANEHRDKRRSAEDELAGFVEKYKEVVEEKTAEASKAERSREARAFAGEQLKLLLPVILAKIAGVPVDGEAIGGAATGQLLDSLTDEQKVTILGALRPEQRIPLYEMLHARVQKAATAKQNGAPPSPTTSTASVSSPPRGPSAAPQTPLSPTGQGVGAPPPEATFTPEEVHDFERMTRWVLNPLNHARYETWFEQTYGKGRAVDKPKTSISVEAPANDTNGATPADQAATAAPASDTTDDGRAAAEREPPSRPP